MKRVKGFLDVLPQELKEVICHISERCVYLGLKAYIVGGAVRDILLGADIYDIDISVEGEVQRLADDLYTNYGYSIISHRDFDTMVLQAKDAGSIDIAAARRETYIKPAALPRVYPSSLREDLFRRDFTINAMAISVIDGALIDPYGGLRDLNSCIIRIMHDKSFIDDPTRIFRGIRFQVRYCFVMDPKTRNLMMDSIEAGYPVMLSNDRIMYEIERILEESRSVEMLKEMETTGLWQRIFGDGTISDVTYERLKNLKKSNAGNITFPVIALMEQMNAGDIKGIFNHYRALYKKVEVYRLKERALKLPISEYPLKPAELYRLLNGTEYMVLKYLLGIGGSECYKNNIREYINCLKDFEFHINGEDLKALGEKPGPRYGSLLERAKLEIVTQNVTDRPGQLKILKSIMGKGG